MNLNLAGKTALVTAASGDIGSGVAAALGEAGVRVAIGGRTLTSLETVAETLASSAGGRPAIVVGDVGAKDGPAQIASEAALVLGGRIDILVNNVRWSETHYRRCGRCLLGRIIHAQLYGCAAPN